MAEQDINRSWEKRPETLQPEIINDNSPEPEKKKSGFFTLLLGIFLTIRGVMRFQEGEGAAFQVFGAVMVIIGLICLYNFVKDRI